MHPGSSLWTRPPPCSVSFLGWEEPSEGLGLPGSRDGIQVLHASPKNKDAKNEAKRQTESVSPRVSPARPQGLDQHEEGLMKLQLLELDSSISKSELHCSGCML